MFRASIAPIIRSKKTVTTASGTGHSNGATTFTASLLYMFRASIAPIIRSSGLIRPRWTASLLYMFRASIAPIIRSSGLIRPRWTASLLYMFRASIAPIIRSIKTVTVASGTGRCTVATTCTRDCGYSFLYS